MGGEWSWVSTNLCHVYYFTALFVGGGIGNGGSCVFIIWVDIALGKRYRDLSFHVFLVLEGIMTNPVEKSYFHSEKKSHGIHTHSSPSIIELEASYSLSLLDYAG